MYGFDKVAIVDIETTGLDPYVDFILEIGIVELDLFTGKTKVLFDSLVREQGLGEEHRNSWIFFNSDLKFEEIRNAPLLTEIQNDIDRILRNYPVSAFNKSFDFGFLKLRGIEIPYELPCIMLTATPVCRIPSRNGFGEFKWPSVQEAWDFFFPGTFYDEKHRASDDAVHEARIFFELYVCGFFSI